ncbi:hypothetical protein HPB51_029524 [Rhipicephalus microplus]|uniref:Uncharacterized protein n=1 Tax=Rhipicephalus microplus TaxID=6941 RepID=A0A9J6CU50_RHIMP|nr:hypothetical protein HPB51_029524 [Rhipicephalus microplus]
MTSGGRQVLVAGEIMERVSLAGGVRRERLLSRRVPCAQDRELSAEDRAVDMLVALFDDVLEEPGEASVTDVTLSTNECILDYLAGYVVKKFSTISGTGCVGTLKSQTREPTDRIQKKSRGFLQAPSSQFLSLLRIVEGHVEELTVETVACADVYANIVDQVLLDSRIASAGVG